VKIELEGGKYTACYEEATGKLYALRHGKPWRDCCGDGFILALMHKIAELEGQIPPVRPPQR